MRLSRVLSLLLPVVALTSLGVACAPSEEPSEGQVDAITGGDSKGGSPIVYLLSSTDARPTCVGTLLSERFAVTTKACADASAGLLVKRADEEKRAIARIKQLHAPSPEADIALLELDVPLEGKTAELAALRVDDGYKIIGASAFATGNDDASIVKGEVRSQTATHGLVVAEKDQRICDSDVGAGVFRKIPKKIIFFKTGDWELSGLIVGREDGAVPTPSPTTGTPDAGSFQPEASQSCSKGPWRVSPLAVHRDFLKRLVPEAFPAPKPPSSGGGGGFGGFPFPFPGVPGSGVSNGLRSCSLISTTLPTLRTGERSASIQAKATFTNVAAGGAVGQFGVAPRNAPANMVWTPATALDPMTAANVESRFEGGINAPAIEGDYVVAFRASADGGVTWTQCDIDGSDNGFSTTSLLSVQVTPNAASTQNPAPYPDYSSSSYNDNDDDDDRPTTTTPPKKKAADSGCSVAHTGGGASQLPVLGLLLGLAAMVRRRSRR